MKTVTKAFGLLDLLSDEPERFRFLAEIASASGMNRATCAVMLSSLVRLGVLEQEGRRKGYRLGPRLYYLARNGPFRRDLVLAARPHLEALANETGETFHLSSVHNGRRVILDSVEGNQDIRVNKDRLTLLDDFFETASGLLLLAFMPDNEREALAAGRGACVSAQPGVSASGKLDSALRKIRRAGMAVVHAKNIVQVAFPVFLRGRVAAALACPVPEFRFKGRNKDRILKRMRDAARDIGAAIGASAGPAGKKRRVQPGL